MSPGQNVSAKAGERASLRCISRYGNPPAKLKWMLGKSKLTQMHVTHSTHETIYHMAWHSLGVKGFQQRTLTDAILSDAYLLMNVLASYEYFHYDLVIIVFFSD
jgi:CD80-like C2-set immunoglobulin domain